MSKITPRSFSIAFCLFLVSCDTATPENYFDRTVLNCNLMHGFAGSGLRRELESPSVKLSESGNGETILMKRKEVIDNVIISLETNFEKVKKLNEIAKSRRQSLAQMAVAWTLRHKVVTSSLIGASKVAHVEEAVAALNNLTFSDSELQSIESALK